MTYTNLDLDIANRALAKLGLREITSITADEESARVINTIYEGVLNFELSIYAWAFALKRASINADNDAPAFEYNFQYSLPADFLRLESIYNVPENMRDAYSIENGKILTNISGPLQIVYLSSTLNQSAWPPYFIEAVACRLAYEICERLKQDPSRKNTLMQEYQLVIGAAKRSNAIQLAIKQLKPTSWEAAHGW